MGGTSYTVTPKEMYEQNNVKIPPPVLPPKLCTYLFIRLSVLYPDRTAIIAIIACKATNMNDL